MKISLFILLICIFTGCRESSELDGTYVNTKSDTFTIYHTHDDWFNARLPGATSPISLEKRNDVMEQKTASDSVLFSIKITGEKKLEVNGEIFSKVSDQVK